MFKKLSSWNIVHKEVKPYVILKEILHFHNEGMLMLKGDVSLKHCAV
jgi:hypothetical protein